MGLHINKPPSAHLLRIRPDTPDTALTIAMPARLTAANMNHLMEIRRRYFLLAIQDAAEMWLRKFRLTKEELAEFILWREECLDTYRDKVRHFEN